MDFSLKLVLTVLVVALATACQNISGTKTVSGFDTKVAKVDTDYVYEGNIAETLDAYMRAERDRISNFIGFSPDVILAIRESAIDTGIRDQVRRFPGVEILQSQIEDLANKNAEAKIREIYSDIVHDESMFEELAIKYSNGDTANDAGRMEPFPKLDRARQYQELAYAMTVGDISQPFRTEEGWTIIRLDEVTTDEFDGNLYTISMILIKPNTRESEAQLVDGYASGHRIEVLDPKYVSHAALLDNDLDRALSEAQRAIDLDSEDSLAYYLKSRVLWIMERYDEAIDTMSRAAEVSLMSDGLKPYYYFFLGGYYEDMIEVDGDTSHIDEALASYSNCFDTLRQNISLAWSLKQVYERLDENENLDLNMGTQLASIQEEIDIMAENDLIINAFARRDAVPGVIQASGARSYTGSMIYKPGYRGTGY
ncbi:MAG TPA: peptidylprolyl isomerase [bacterium]|jgi:tetratricopeptide (TPR) repeat protein